MPRRTDLKKILLIGSGPIVIGQACEFDYTGTQACKALREEGYDGRPGQLQPGHHHDRPGDGRPHLHRADHLGSRRQDHRDANGPTPCCRRSAARPASTRRWTCTSTASSTSSSVEMIGANAEVIDKAEDREKFKQAMIKIGLDVPKSGVARTLAEAQDDPRAGRPAVRAAAQLHAGRHRRRHRLQPRGVQRADRPRPRPQPRRRGADRGVGHRLEGVRAGGDARPGRQRRHRLLDRELRPDGRPHRRLASPSPRPRR